MRGQECMLESANTFRKAHQCHDDRSAITVSTVRNVDSEVSGEAHSHSEAAGSAKVSCVACMPGMGVEPLVL